MGTVDWTKPIEAVHTDGRVQPIDRRDTSRRNETTWFVHLDGGTRIAENDGTLLFMNWSIRNVEPTLRTSDEALRRMEALVERMTQEFATDTHPYLDEARAIQALRSPPLDPRIALVVTALVQNGIGKPVAPLFARDVLKALDAAAA